MTFSHSLATDNYGPAKFIVSANIYEGTHTTIGAALTSASSGDTIFIRPGTYTENLTLKAGVNLTAYGSDSSLNATGLVIISGTCTLTTAGTVTISGIQLQTNSAALLAVTGSAASIVNLNNCYLNCTNNTGITFSTSNAAAQINIYFCNGNLATTGIAYFAHSSAGSLSILHCNLSNTGNATTANTVSAGILGMEYTAISSPITSSGTTAIISTRYCLVKTDATNTTALTINSTNATASPQEYSSFSGGTSSAISIGAGALVNLIACDVQSSNTNAITGAGAINYTGINFLPSTSFVNNVTTQSGGTLVGSRNTAPAAGFLGEQIRNTASGTSLPNTTPTNLTSINLTAGVWDVSLIASFAYIGATTATLASISAVSATRGTALGDNFAQMNLTVTGLTLTLTVPSFRVIVNTTTTYYLVTETFFSTGTCIGSGRLSATRVG